MPIGRTSDVRQGRQLRGSGPRAGSASRGGASDHAGARRPLVAGIVLAVVAVLAAGGAFALVGLATGRPTAAVARTPDTLHIAGAVESVERTLTSDGRDLLSVRVSPNWTGLSLELGWSGDRQRTPRLPVLGDGSCWSSAVHEGPRSPKTVRIDYFQPDEVCSEALVIDLQDVESASAFQHRALEAPAYRISFRYGIDGIRPDDAAIVTTASAERIVSGGDRWAVASSNAVPVAAGGTTSSCSLTDPAAGTASAWRCSTAPLDPAQGRGDTVMLLPGASYDLTQVGWSTVRNVLLIGAGVLAGLVAAALVALVGVIARGRMP